MENEEQTTAAGAAGVPEGTPGAGPTADEIAELYAATGVKAPVPTGKPKGRPKANAGGASADSEEDDASGAAGKGQVTNSGSDKSKTSSAASGDGGDGDASDPSGEKVGKKDGKNGAADGKVSESGEDDAAGVSADESKDNGAAAKTGEDDANDGADGAGQGEGEPGDETQDAKDAREAEEGKRPGKSSPEVERRMQQLVADKKAAEERAEALEKQLSESAQLIEKTKIAAEDPEYTIEDFAKVRDEEGNILDLDKNQAELAWRRWKDGYEERAEVRQAAANKAADEAAAEERATHELMEKSVAAYDALAALQDEYPELVSTSSKFDEDFSAEAMPIIKDSLEYLEGTEPGNAEGNKPIIIGLKINPKKILDALKNISTKKRSLPLNGMHDNVETRSNVAVPHSRSSDPTVQAANDLMKTLNINKRF